ncbi:MAG: two-component sensor histidine kinase [Acidobacteria bacterium]|nr:MAG: two-component sensor histidine kinase [Acidobacteriota bacterium]
MRGPVHPRRPPPWWPANEPWPPATRGPWLYRRNRFMRRAGCLVAAVLFLSAIGAATLLSFALGRAGIVSGLAQLSVLVVVAAIGLLLFSMMFLRVMRRVGSPIADIVEAADRVASSDFSVRIAERGPPPLRSVAHAFNKMTDRLQAQDRQRRHLMADIAHELRTPLTVVQGRLEGLLDGVYPRDDAHVSEVLADTRILGRLIDDLRTLASSESGALSLQREATDLVVLVHDVVRSLAADAQGAGVTIRIGESMNLPLADVDPLRIREVVVNLVTNALHHTPAGGVVSIDGEAKNDRVVMTVADTGAGVAADDLPKIFDRFYKGAGSRGSGLGLTIARNLIVAHGGEIRATSEPGTGTTIVFTLPVIS